MQRLWLVMVGLGLLTFAALSAHAALKAVTSHPDGADPNTSSPAKGYEADDHFPGAALLYADVATAAPAAGVTGTIELPALPEPAQVAAALSAASGDTGVTAARPFSTNMASAIDRGRALECLTAAIYYEAASEPLQGQEAVAQVILNRARHPVFPATVCGVVYQGSERAGCQFSFACDGAMQRVPSAGGWARAARVAAAALAGYVYAPVGLATHYHTYAVTPAWNRSLVMTDMIGAHLFHRWKGYWGTAAAFRQIYRGGEPVPGPHALMPVSPVVPAAPPVIAAAAPAPITPVATIRPPYADSGAAKSLPKGGDDRLPPPSTVLDKWKDVGTLR
jgi:spore germination cell wall hydrolase CwlJ-like protein